MNLIGYWSIREYDLPNEAPCMDNQGDLSGWGGYWSIQEYGFPDEPPCIDYHGDLSDEVRIWWDLVMSSTFSNKKLQDVTWDEFRAEFDWKYFPLDVK